MKSRESDVTLLSSFASGPKVKMIINFTHKGLNPHCQVHIPTSRLKSQPPKSFKRDLFVCAHSLSPLVVLVQFTYKTFWGFFGYWEHASSWPKYLPHQNPFSTYVCQFSIKDFLLLFFQLYTFKYLLGYQ